MDLSQPLNLIDVSAQDNNAGACCGGGCCCGPAGEADEVADAIASAVTTELGVTGMTCGHCVSSVTEEISALPGVDSVDVQLAAGGVSTVRIGSNAPIDVTALRSAVEEAGYALAE